MALIRVSTIADASSLQSIYGPFCLPAATASFELAPPSVDEMGERISTVIKKYPWIVYEIDGTVVGYASANQYNPRAAYDWSVSVSIYLSDGARGAGIGKKLYGVLFDILRLQGFFNAYALITVPNDASIGLHKTMGFVDVGLTPKVGYKAEQWLDVAILWLELQAHGLSPRAIVPFSQIVNDPQFAALLTNK